MVAAVGGSPDLFAQADSSVQGHLAERAQQFGLATVLAAMQMIDQTISRLRYSTHGRVLAELVLVRICQLGDLEDLSAIIEQFRSAGGVSASMPPRPSVPAASATQSPARTPPRWKRTFAVRERFKKKR